MRVPLPPRRRRGPGCGPVPRGSRPVLGIEIARGGLRFVELRNVAGRPVLLNHGEVAYGTTEELVGALRLLVDEYGVLARDVHVVDSTSRANLKIQSLPVMPDSDLDAIIRGEIDSEAELMGESLVGDWMLLRKTSSESEVLIGRLPAQDRAALVSACEQADFRLQVVTSSSVILARHLLATDEVPAGETVGLLDIGRSKMNMALFTHEHLRLVREVYQGLSASFLKNEPGEGEPDLELIGAGLDEVVGTVQQIKRTVEQYVEQNAGTVVHHLVLTGETTRISRLTGLMQHDLQVPVRTYNPAACLDPGSLPKGFPDVAPTFAVPWVLATTPASAIPLNFAEGVPDRRPVRVLQGVAAAALVGVLVAGFVQVKGAQRLARLEATLASVESERATLEADLGLLEDVQVAWEQWLGESVARAGCPSPDLRPHLLEVARALPDDVRLTRLAFRREGDGWIVDLDAVAQGPSTTGRHAAMERFVRAVNESPLLHEVAMKPLTYEDDRIRKVRSHFEFSVVARVRPVEREAKT